MIKLDVKDYCQWCMDFEANVIDPVRYEANDNHVIQTDTIVQCSRRKRCEAIKNYLLRCEKKHNTNEGM